MFQPIQNVGYLYIVIRCARNTQQLCIFTKWILGASKLEYCYNFINQLVKVNAACNRIFIRLMYTAVLDWDQ